MINDIKSDFEAIPTLNMLSMPVEDALMQVADTLGGAKTGDLMNGQSKQ